MPVVDDQDQREKDLLVYFTGDNEVKQRVEKENLQDVLKVLDRIKPNKNVSLVITMLQSVVALLTQILNLKKKNKPKEYYIDYARQMARKYFVDERILCATIEAESSFNPLAYNKNVNGSEDYGIAQFNSEF